MLLFVYCVYACRFVFVGWLNAVISLVLIGLILFTGNSVVVNFYLLCIKFLFGMVWVAYLFALSAVDCCVACLVWCLFRYSCLLLFGVCGIGGLRFVWVLFVFCCFAAWCCCWYFGVEWCVKIVW